MLYQRVRVSVNARQFSLDSVPDNVEHAINGLDMRQEGISKSLSLGSPLDQAGNVGDLQIRWVHGRRLPKVTEKVLQVMPISATHWGPFYGVSRLTYRASGTAHLASLGSIVQKG